MIRDLTAIGSIVQTIRLELSSRSFGTAKGRKHVPGKATGSRADTRLSLTALLQRRVAEIAPDDPDRANKAFHAFLESVLLASLGEHLINSPEFHQMVLDIERTLEADGSLAEMIATAKHSLVNPVR